MSSTFNPFLHEQVKLSGNKQQYNRKTYEKSLTTAKLLFDSFQYLRLLICWSVLNFKKYIRFFVKQHTNRTPPWGGFRY